MSALSRFEGFMSNIVEGSVQRLFRSPVQPAEIARRLERAMESQQTISVDRVIVPAFYRAFLHPDDFKVFEPIQESLEREMANYLRELARERGFTLLEHPAVDVAPDPAVSRRGIQVVAEMSLAPGHAQGGIEGTQVIPMGGRDGVRVQQTTAQLVLDTPEGPHAFPLGTSLVTIGRGLNNDLIVEDARVSRQHAQIRYKSRRFFIGDLGSTNGTYVNGTQVTTDQVLHDGDTVSFGGLEMHFYQR
jgi:hypothetical protein